MAEQIKTCHYCGNTFIDKGGFNESPRVKDTKWGKAYAVCSLKCAREHDEYRELSSSKRKEKSHEEISEKSENVQSNSFVVGIIAFGSLIGGIYLIYLGELIMGIVLIVVSAVINYIYNAFTGKRF